MSIVPMALFSIYIPVTQPFSTTEYDNSKTIYFKSGTIFYLRPQKNSNMGYSWQFSLIKGLSFLMDRYYSSEFSKEDERFVVGAVGFYSWVI